MYYYKKKQEINKCLRHLFPSGIEIIIEEYNKEPVPWKEEIKEIYRPIYKFGPSIILRYNIEHTWLSWSNSSYIIDSLFKNKGPERQVKFINYGNYRRGSYQFEEINKEWKWQIPCDNSITWWY